MWCCYCSRPVQRCGSYERHAMIQGLLVDLSSTATLVSSYMKMRECVWSTDVIPVFTAGLPVLTSCSSAGQWKERVPWPVWRTLAALWILSLWWETSLCVCRCILQFVYKDMRHFYCQSNLSKDQPRKDSYVFVSVRLLIPGKLCRRGQARPSSTSCGRTSWPMRNGSCIRSAWSLRVS